MVGVYKLLRTLLLHALHDEELLDFRSKTWPEINRHEQDKLFTAGRTCINTALNLH